VAARRLNAVAERRLIVCTSNAPLRVVALRSDAPRLEAILIKLGPLLQTPLTLVSRSPRP
jgi:hypothetical protein